jgi:hypothetical protein
MKNDDLNKKDIRRGDDEVYNKIRAAREMEGNKDNLIYLGSIERYDDLKKIDVSKYKTDVYDILVVWVDRANKFFYYLDDEWVTEKETEYVKVYEDDEMILELDVNSKEIKIQPLIPFYSIEFDHEKIAAIVSQIKQIPRDFVLDTLRLIDGEMSYDQIAQRLISKYDEVDMQFYELMDLIKEIDEEYEYWVNMSPNKLYDENEEIDESELETIDMSKIYNELVHERQNVEEDNDLEEELDDDDIYFDDEEDEIDDEDVYEEEIPRYVPVDDFEDEFDEDEYVDLGIRADTEPVTEVTDEFDDMQIFGIDVAKGPENNIREMKSDDFEDNCDDVEILDDEYEDEDIEILDDEDCVLEQSSPGNQTDYDEIMEDVQTESDDDDVEILDDEYEDEDIEILDDEDEEDIGIIDNEDEDIPKLDYRNDSILNSSNKYDRSTTNIYTSTVSNSLIYTCNKYNSQKPSLFIKLNDNYLQYIKNSKNIIENIEINDDFNKIELADDLNNTHDFTEMELLDIVKIVLKAMSNENDEFESMIEQAFIKITEAQMWLDLYIKNKYN